MAQIKQKTIWVVALALATTLLEGFAPVVNFSPDETRAFASLSKAAAEAAVKDVAGKQVAGKEVAGKEVSAAETMESSEASLNGDITENSDDDFLPAIVPDTTPEDLLEGGPEDLPGDWPDDGLSVASLVSARDSLSDLERFPLFLANDQARLVATSTRLPSTRLNQPSLTWVQEQLGDRYGSDRLVEQWYAYRVRNVVDGNRLNYVDVIVNERIWGLLTYFERYAFILQFGTAAQGDGYHLRIFHSGDAANVVDAATSGGRAVVALRGAYICDFAAVPGENESANSGATAPCEVVFNAFSTGRRAKPAPQSPRLF
jgi:hypothetical protein